MANSQATQGTEVNQATEVDQFLNYNYKDKKLVWNGSVNDLETFLKNKLSSATEDGNNSTINRINYSTNTKYTIFKSGHVTVKFYPTTGTLQIQGKQGSDLKSKLLDILSPNLDTRNNECTDKELDLEVYSSGDEDSVAISDLPSDLRELENFIDSVAEIQEEQLQSTTVCAHEEEMAKLWKAIELINSKLKSLELINSKVESPAKKVSEKFNQDVALTCENESLKQKLHEAELETQRLPNYCIQINEYKFL